MKRQFLSLSCAALLSLVSCRDKLELGNTPTASFFTKLEAGRGAKYVVIPDAQFRAYLKALIPEAFFGRTLNVMHEAVKGVTRLNLKNYHIGSLSGIEFFTSLIELDCSDNELTKLNLSKNVHLRYLNYCKNPKLKSYRVILGNLDPSIVINCFSSANLVVIPDLQFRRYLKEILPTVFEGDLLNVSHEKLKKITKIDVSGLSIEDLSGIKYFTGLTKLYCSSNKLLRLDVSHNVALRELKCEGSHLKSLDLSANTALEELNCRYNRLETLDLSANTALKVLQCSGNGLTSLDVSANTALTELYGVINKLETLDVSANTALRVLECSGNELTSLDLSANTALEELDCRYNQLTSLALPENRYSGSLKLNYCGKLNLKRKNIKWGNFSHLSGWGCYGVIVPKQH